MIAVYLGVQEIPADFGEGNSGKTTPPRDEVYAEAEDYHAAVAAAKRQVPDGWMSIYVRTTLPKERTSDA